MPLEELKEALLDADLKVTQQRLVILGALTQRKDHPTAEGLYEHVKPQNPSISIGTVYKTLDRFNKVGLVRKVLTDTGLIRYDANLKFHNHIYCTNTGEIVDFYDERLSQMLRQYFSEKGIDNLKINEIQVLVNGEKIDLSKEVNNNKFL